jgi:Lon protease-like protein
MARLEEMPLFPLHTVLFPYAPLQLHVFEDRYRDMIRNCLDYELPFGIVLIRSGEETGELAEPYMVGTAVRITSVHEFEDGRLDVRVEGSRRFRIRKLSEENPYLVGYVEPVAELEMDMTPRAEALVHRAREGFEELIQMAIGRPDFSISIRSSKDPTVLSFIIASFLPIDNLEKQRLLETTDSSQRLADLIPIIERLIEAAAPPKMHRLTPENLKEWISDN